MLNEAYERLVAAIRAAGAYDAPRGDWYIVVHGDGAGVPTGHLVYRFLGNGWERGPFTEAATIPTPRAAAAAWRRDEPQTENL